MLGFEIRRKPKASKVSKKKRPKHFADYIIYLSVAAILGYTVAAVVLQFSGAMELSPTLTTCWYAFWTVEIVALATIKISKVRTDFKQKLVEKPTETESEV